MSRLPVTTEHLHELRDELNELWKYARHLHDQAGEDRLQVLALEELTRRLELAARRSALLELYHLRELSHREEGAA